MSALDDKTNQIRLNAGAVQNIPAELQHLIPEGYTTEQLTAWFEINQSTLAAMTARHIAIERGLIKPKPTE